MDIEEINRNLKGMRCPNVNCGGTIEKCKEKWCCSECKLTIQNRSEYWKKVDEYQDQAIHRSLHRLSAKCVSS